jgi:hypothetical protein
MSTKATLIFEKIAANANYYDNLAQNYIVPVNEARIDPVTAPGPH